MADADRQFLSQYAEEVLGLAVAVNGVPTDVDGDSVIVAVVNEDSNTPLTSGNAEHAGLGQYQLTLYPELTSTKGNYYAQWTYHVGSELRTFRTYFAIGGGEPLYDNLTPDLKAIVDSVWVRFADLFDSPAGGPNLQTYRQTNWGRGRIAQMLRLALGRLNTVAQPYSSYSIDSATGTAFPTNRWGAVLEQATYVEALKHLRRSYVEQPEYQGGSITRLDRRDYMQRWGEVLADEEALLRPQLDHFKIKQMGLGSPSILVSGGIFGRYTPVNMPGMAAQPHLWYANYF